MSENNPVFANAQDGLAAPEFPPRSLPAPCEGAEAANKPAPGWRGVFSIHPAAEMFPLMAETDAAALKELTHADRRPLAAHVWRKEALGFYIEPEWVDERLFATEIFDGVIYDPACGIGRIPDAAQRADYQTLATDIVDRGYSKFYGLVDFLQSDRRTDNIVTNPPYQDCRAFALHALKLAARKVAMIWLARRLNAAHWLQSTPLARVYFLTPRPSMPPGHVILAGEKPGGGKQDFVWLVWSHGHVGPPEMHWLRRNAP